MELKNVHFNQNFSRKGGFEVEYKRYQMGLINMLIEWIKHDKIKKLKNRKKTRKLVVVKTGLEDQQFQKILKYQRRLIEQSNKQTIMCQLIDQ